MTTTVTARAPEATGGAPVRLGDISIDRVGLVDALRAIARLVDRRQGGVVFTPNADHVVLATRDVRFRTAYRRADLRVADGMVVVWASHLLGTALPERVAGSDLVVPLMETARRRAWRVYFLGGAEGVAREAARRLQSALPGLAIVGVDAPRIELDKDRTGWRLAADRIRESRADLVLVALGAPKQEVFIDEIAARARPAVLLGVGAALDFVAGTARRAPPGISRLGLEWLYRLAREPRRLWRRYLVRDPEFFVIVARELLRRRGAPEG